MIDGSEKRKGQLAFELQNSPVFEKRNKFFGNLAGQCGSAIVSTVDTLCSKICALCF